MAFEMSYVAPDGGTYPASYWRPVQINIGVADKTARVLFYGYRSQQARNNGKAPISQKSYDLEAMKFDDYFSAAKLALKDPMAQGYQLAKDTLDSGGASFFAGAIDV